MQFEEKPGSLCTLISCSSNGYHGHLKTEKITQTAKISVILTITYLLLNQNNNKNSSNDLGKKNVRKLMSNVRGRHFFIRVS